MSIQRLTDFQKELIVKMENGHRLVHDLFSDRWKFISPTGAWLKTLKRPTVKAITAQPEIRQRYGVNCYIYYFEVGEMISSAGTENFRNFADSPLDFSRLPLYCKNMGVENPCRKRQSDRQPVRFLKFSIADSLYLLGLRGRSNPGVTFYTFSTPADPFYFCRRKAERGKYKSFHRKKV